MVSRRRIDGLKQLAYDCGLTNDNAKSFGKLSKTSTWEALLNSHGLEYERKNEITNNTVATASQELSHSISFFEWVDFGQLIALTLASVGIFLLIFSLMPRALHIPSVKITIQVGAK